MQSSNQDIAKLLRSVAAVLTLKKANQFQIRAYENAADAIEHLTSEVKDLWEENKLDQVPGIGANLQKYLAEYFKIGYVKHFNTIIKSHPKVFFDLLDLPGIGPKTADEIVNLGIKDLKDLKDKIKNGKIVKKGFSAKIAEKIISVMEEVEGRSTRRMLLPYASAQAQKILEYLKSSKDVLEAHPLGSLRRGVATIGDLDFSASADDPEKVVKHFVKMPGIEKVTDQGANKATIILFSGLHIDLLVGKPESYGALLQHFTGSKHHNIKLRTYAEKKGLSINEYGVRDTYTNKLVATKTEEQLYKILGMDIPDPEIREDAGEIEASIKHNLPKLIEINDIKGELHLHSNFPLEPSHGPGADSIEGIVKKAIELGYEFVGISDHPPGFTTHTNDKITKLLEKRNQSINDLKKRTKSIRVLNGLEVDILGNGGLSVSDEGMKSLDYVIAGIHSGHRGSKEVITKRILKALENPHVHILAHPTGRLLNERNSYEADWEEIFKFCAKHNKLLEINGYPNRLDLRDDLVRMAIGFGVKFIINSDAHAIEQMDNLPFGVIVARRGWATKNDVVNSWNWKKLTEWFKMFKM